MTIDIRKALSEVTSGAKQFNKHDAFWFIGPIPDLIKGTAIDSKVHLRIKRVRQELDKARLPSNGPWLTQLMLWQKVKGGSAKTHVLWMKYTLLEECMKRGMPWDRTLDDHIEALALSAYREHKEKAR